MRGGQAAKASFATLGALVAALSAKFTAAITVPALLYIGYVSIGLNAGLTLIKIGKNIKQNLDIESRIVASAADDVAEIKAILSRCDTTRVRLTKHMQEVGLLQKNFEDDYNETMDVYTKLLAEWDKLSKALSEAEKSPIFNASDVAKKKKKVREVHEMLTAMAEACHVLRAKIREIDELFGHAEKLNIHLEKISERMPDTFMSNLAGARKKHSNWMSAADTITSLGTMTGQSWGG